MRYQLLLKRIGSGQYHQRHLGPTCILDIVHVFKNKIHPTWLGSLTFQLSIHKEQHHQLIPPQLYEEL